METLKQDILKSRNIKDISLKNYLSSINQLSKKITGEEFKNIDFLKNYDKVMSLINKMKETTKKNYLTSIVVSLKAYQDKYKNEINKYSKILKEVSEKYQNELKNQTKTETQTKNWMTYEELNNVKNNLKDIYNKNKTFENLQKYLMLLTYLNHPLRNDYAHMKISTQFFYNKLSNEEQEKYNYLIIAPKNKMYFYINQFKNKNRIGCKKIEITDKELKRIINKWLKINNSGWYFVKLDKKTPQTPNNTTKYLNSIFKPYNKKISSSMIRHISITHDTKNDPTIKEIEEKDKKIENKYLHSSIINKQYRKIK